MRSLIELVDGKPVEELDPSHVRAVAHAVTESLAYNMVRVFSAANWVDRQHGIQTND